MFTETRGSERSISGVSAGRSCAPGARGASPAGQPFLRDDEITVVEVGDAVPRVEEVASLDGKPDGLVPRIPALDVPHSHAEAERVQALGQRQRAQPADE